LKLVERIPETFANYRQTNAVYWSCLHTVAKLVLAAGLPRAGTAGWSAFLNGPYRAIEGVLLREYGQPPRETEIAIATSSEYEYEEEEDYED
jgi:hypothetical protein